MSCLWTDGDAQFANWTLWWSRHRHRQSAICCFANDICEMSLLVEQTRSTFQAVAGSAPVVKSSTRPSPGSSPLFSSSQFDKGWQKCKGFVSEPLFKKWERFFVKSRGNHRGNWGKASFVKLARWQVLAWQLQMDASEWCSSSQMRNSISMNMSDYRRQRSHLREKS